MVVVSKQAGQDDKAGVGQKGQKLCIRHGLSMGGLFSDSTANSTFPRGGNSKSRIAAVGAEECTSGEGKAGAAVGPLIGPSRPVWIGFDRLGPASRDMRQLLLHYCPSFDCVMRDAQSRRSSYLTLCRFRDPPSYPPVGFCKFRVSCFCLRIETVPSMYLPCKTHAMTLRSR